MKALPSLSIALLLALSAALLPAQARDGGGATVVFQAGLSGGTLYANGVVTPYDGAEITGTDNVAIYNRSSDGILSDLGTVTRNPAGSLSLGINATSAWEATLTITAGSTFTAARTLSLESGSTVSFGGTLNAGPDLTLDPGATLVTNAVSTLDSGVTFNAGVGSTITSAGLVKTGAGTLILSPGTLALGGNSTINNGILTFGDRGTITTGATLSLGAGSILASNATIAANTAGALTLQGGVPNGLTFNAGVGAITLVNSGTITSPLIFNGTANGTLTIGAIGNNLTINSPTTLAITGANTLFKGNITVSPSTTFNILASQGLALNKIPTIRGSFSTMGTAIKFLDGLNTNGGTISILYLPAVQKLAGDAVSLHISEFDTAGYHEKYVLQMSYDPTAAAALGNLLGLYLAWFDPSDSTWKNAVDGNSDGGATAQFVGGAYDPAADFNLGYYGVDTATSTVWAVIDHNSTFGVTNFEATPEPSSAAFLVCGLALLARRSRQRSAAR